MPVEFERRKDVQRRTLGRHMTCGGTEIRMVVAQDERRNIGIEIEVRFTSHIDERTTMTGFRIDD